MIERLVIEDPNRTAVKWWPNTEALKGRTEFIFTPGINVLLGPNGCGKSTVIRVMANLFHCAQGGVPKVTSHSLSEAVHDRHTSTARLLDGARPVHDGKSVSFCDPSVERGVFGGQFDEDFFMEGIQSTMFKGSTGERTGISLPRIFDTIEGKNVPAVEWAIPKPDPKERERYPATHLVESFLAGNGGTPGPHTILLDEPERALRLMYQHRMWNRFTGLCKAQVIVATHCPFALGYPPDKVNYIELVPGYLDECMLTLRAFAKRFPPGALL